MTVDTRRVKGRRKLSFASYDEILAEAERLAQASRVRTLGNWSLGQAFFHLAAGMRAMLDGTRAPAPWLARLLGPSLKWFILNRPMPAGFRLPPASAAELIADHEVESREGLESLREAVGRMNAASSFRPHPIFGSMTPDQTRRLHCRHAELHLSFYVPDDEP
ncbi:MAG: DUF1569 domain-containing protein [Pirellulales bacterium]